MIMRTKDGPQDADPVGRVEEFVGVEVQVSFTEEGERQSMKQIAGGQKTVVALTLILLYSVVILHCFLCKMRLMRN